MAKYVYAFDEGDKSMKDLLGGKGANLAEMTKIGLLVPSGFTVTTEACVDYYNSNKTISEEIVNQIYTNVEMLEKKSGKSFGNPNNPLLVSVRSGARVSMPGMMDTVLNLGINDEVVEGLAKKTNNVRFAYDSYRRFIQMFADVVKGYPKESFEKYFDRIKEEKNISDDLDLTGEDMKEITQRFKSNYFELSGEQFPQNPKTQLIEAVQAVFRSWMNDRAITYRKLNNIPEEWGTAVNVQEMVYGNSGENSGTGVAFTRNPATGENKLYGEYLINAQGEDVVAGIRTPKPIETLKEIMPDIYEQFSNIAKKLEEHYKDMQDMEFTIEDGKLYMLQTRNGKRTARAAIKIAVDLVQEKKITKEEALLRIDPNQLDQLLHPTFDNDKLMSSTVIAKGLAASPGAATGKLCFSAEDAVKLHNSGEKDLILVRTETSPEDIEGMNVVNGVLTVRGGMTSHAAVVARGMGTCCICGCGEIVVDEVKKTLTTLDGTVYKEMDYLSLDGSTGNVYGEKIDTVDPEISGEFETLMNWADEIRRLEVRTNADTPRDAIQAYKFGAQGIGLCRTEHMFFEESRIFAMRKMIVAENLEQRKVALSKILPMQREDFEGLFRAMNGLPVTVRYLDPPLHEFLPHTDEEIKELASSIGIPFEKLKERVESLKEFNPMMGHRGCRLDVTYPEIAVMQTTAIIEAALNVKNEGIPVKPEIMIPLIGDLRELKYVKAIVVETAENIFAKKNDRIDYHIGTMIEVPRAAILADEIASEAEFFSFGTNDLTQLSYGFSRDDSGKFLKDYYKKKIFNFDPFAKIDQHGIGKLMEIAIEKGKSVRPDIELGICGEHAGEPESICYCDKIGLTYVSCSPFRVPTARLAAAQASIRSKQSK